MANKQISALPAASTVGDSDLFVIEQQGIAKQVTGAQYKGFAVGAVQPYATAASGSATAAAGSATNAAASAQVAQSSATAAAGSASTAQQYSGKPPIIQNDTWWTWNAETGQYEDTGESARGNVLLPVFSIDPQTGELTMTTPDDYDGPTFEIVNGYLEVTISA